MTPAPRLLPLGLAVASLAIAASALILGAAFAPLRWLTEDVVFVYPWTVRVDVAPDVAAKIESIYRATRHKRALPVTPLDDWWHSNT